MTGERSGKATAKSLDSFDGSQNWPSKKTQLTPSKGAPKVVVLPFDRAAEASRSLALYNRISE
jgi:hypothetical protein